MSADRCRVCVHLHGQTQYFQRDREEKRDGKWVAIPFFVIDRREAVVMSEGQAHSLFNKIRSLGWRGDIWIETHDGRRIDVAQPVHDSGEDHREPVIATLDDANWFIVKPINRPAEGRMWFISIRVPGFPDPVVLYAREPLVVLQKADGLSYLQFAEKYQWPVEPQQVATIPQNHSVRRRPGDLFQ